MSSLYNNKDKKLLFYELTRYFFTSTFMRLYGTIYLSTTAFYQLRRDRIELVTIINYYC